MSFSTTIDVRFGDCDPAGIVYYPVLFHYCHIAFEELWEPTVGVSYPDLIGKNRIGFPTVHVESDFFYRVAYGEQMELRVWVSKVGTTSVVFEFEGRVDQRLALRSSHTKVCVELDTFEKCVIPAHLSAALRSLTE